MESVWIRIEEMKKGGREGRPMVMRYGLVSVWFIKIYAEGTYADIRYCAEGITAITFRTGIWLFGRL